MTVTVPGERSRGRDNSVAASVLVFELALGQLAGQRRFRAGARTAFVDTQLQAKAAYGFLALFNKRARVLGQRIFCGDKYHDFVADRLRAMPINLAAFRGSEILVDLALQDPEVMTFIDIEGKVNADDEADLTSKRVRCGKINDVRLVDRHELLCRWPQKSSPIWRLRQSLRRHLEGRGRYIRPASSHLRRGHS